MYKRIYVAAVAVAIAASAHADKNAVPSSPAESELDSLMDVFMLDQVVVTSSKSEVKRRESPSLVNVMTGKLLTTVGACSLADGLDFQPGVRVENDCQNCGFTQVRINGLDGHYSQILMNSRPVFNEIGCEVFQVTFHQLHGKHTVLTFKGTAAGEVLFGMCHGGTGQRTV